MLELNKLIEAFRLNEPEERYMKNKLEIDDEDMLKLITMLGRKRNSRFVIDDQNREFYTNAGYWFMNDDRMVCKDPITGASIRGRLDKGLYIAGPTGTGKSVALDIIKELEKKNPRRKPSDLNGVHYQNRDSITVRADEITDEFARTGDVERFKKAFSLAIQDLGSEPTETLYMGNRVNVLKSIIEYRGDNPNLQTFVTSNLSLKSETLMNKYGDRCVSRLKEMMNYMTLTGKDRRENYKR